MKTENNHRTMNGGCIVPTIVIVAISVYFAYQLMMTIFKCYAVFKAMPADSRFELIKLAVYTLLVFAMLIIFYSTLITNNKSEQNGRKTN